MGDSARKQNEKSSGFFWLSLCPSLSAPSPGDCPFINTARSQVVTALQIVDKVQIGQWLHHVIRIGLGERQLIKHSDWPKERPLWQALYDNEKEEE